MEWLPPKEKNGIITGYRVAYKQRDEPDSSAVVDDSLDASRRDFSVNGLIREKNYVFSITAKTRLGLGEVASVDVLTMINRGMYLGLGTVKRYRYCKIIIYQGLSRILNMTIHLKI